MYRLLYSYIFILLLAACGQGPAKPVPAEGQEKDSIAIVQQQPHTDTLTTGKKMDTLPVTAQPAAMIIDSKDFTVFFDNFRKVIGGYSMRPVADFVNFPFDEQDGLWTKEQFLKSFQLEREYVRLIKTTRPFKKNANEYWLNGDDGGLIFKQNNMGYWKWFKIYYAE